MGDTTNCEKLAGVFNRASQQGKSAFCKMLWGNQPETVQIQLKPLLSQEAIDVLQSED
jgi:outer membrane biogenesis lipoprotein LolB